MARSPLARGLGLAFLETLPRDDALVLERCRSIHTVGMRVPLDVVFVDREWRPLRVVYGLAPGRFAGCRGAHAAIEIRAGEGDRLLAGLSLRRARAAGT
jgi:uncharacterized protein